MKRCPECRRDYYDETLLYCLDDGTALLEGPATGDSREPMTAKMDIPATPSNRASEAETKAQMDVRSASKAASLKYLIGIPVVIVVIAGFGYGIFSLVRGRDEAPLAANSITMSLKVQPMTQSGNIREAAISPEGRFLAFTEQSGGKNTVFTKQISTNSKVQIVPPTELDYVALRFSPDGEFVYYTINEKGRSSLYRVPTLGGTPVKQMDVIDGPPSFSPDAKEIAFERYEMTSGRSALLIRNLESGSEHEIVSRTGQQYINGPSVAWSPDGKVIAFAEADDTVSHNYTFFAVDVASGKETGFGKKIFAVISSASWKKDGAGLIFVASDKGRNVPRQIWEIAYPTGEAREVTHDLMGYTQISMTADGKTILTVQRDSTSNIWLSKEGSIDKGEQITHDKAAGDMGISLTPDGRIVYVSTANGSIELWSVRLDGAEPRQLTSDGVSKYTPVVSSDGKYIVYVSEKDGTDLWRCDINGQQATQITHGSENNNPRITPDSKWIIFDSFRSGTLRLWKIPIDGGEPTALTDQLTYEPAISPDGSLIACFMTEPSSDKIQLAVLGIEGGVPTKTFEIPPTTEIDLSPAWTPDGKGITYIDWPADITNLWVQPLAGGKPRQMNAGKLGILFRREWTLDGKQLVFAKGSETSDAVMITGF